MVVFRQYFASLLYNTVIVQALLIWTTSVIMGGRSAMVSLALSSLSLVLMWMCAIGFSVFVAFVLPLVSSSPIPYVSSPWLVVGLFGAPAVLGAFIGQHLGYLILLKYLTKTFSRRNANLPLVVQEDLAKLDAERWLFKAGLLQWLVLLIVGNFYKIGSSYLALAWLASPAFACKSTFISFLIVAVYDMDMRVHSLHEPNDNLDLVNHIFWADTCSVDDVNELS